MAEANYPFFLFRDLPVTSLPITEDTTLIAVLNNSTTVRVSVNDLLTNYITRTPSAPGSPTDGGEAGNIDWDNTGIYTYYNGQWGKAPLYNSNWNDLTASTRFLLVNAVMQLSEEELENVYNSLQLKAATTTSAGFVTLAKSMDSATGGVPTNAQVREYVTNQLANFNVTVQEIPPATTNSYGTVKLAYSIASGTAGVTSAAQVKEYVSTELTTATNGLSSTANVEQAKQDAISTSQAYTNNAISAATANMATESYVTNAIAEALKDYTPGTGIDLSNYEGVVNIKGPDGNLLLRYDAESKTLYIGEGVSRVVVRATDDISFQDTAGTTQTMFPTT